MISDSQKRERYDFTAIFLCLEWTESADILGQTHLENRIVSNFFFTPQMHFKFKSLSNKSILTTVERYFDNSKFGVNMHFCVLPNTYSCKAFHSV